MIRSSGILADRNIAALFQDAAFTSAKALDSDQIQPASLDLRLGEKAYRVRSSFMPGYNIHVRDKLERLKLHEIDLKEGAVLETGCVYIVPLLESLSLPDCFSALANPKSSTGRLDIFTRVITNGAHEFDKIPAGYHGPLYLEISPRTFPIIVRTGSRLSQIRFRHGTDRLNEAMLLQLHMTDMLVSDHKPNLSEGRVALSIDLIGENDHLIGYRGKRHTGVIDIDQCAAYDVLDFWEPIFDRGMHELVLDPNEFYILTSREFIHIPPLYAAEMTPYDPLVGEFRVHYAGFFDPGFGNLETSDGKGARAVLEIRSHEVPFILEHGQIVCRLIYEYMLEQPRMLYGQNLGSSYQSQRLKLSKHFREYEV
ncbi:MAG: dCTP deaminase [Candidatus Tokpelaia sp. JSC085]|nr:MAG: dCTP deaminase [Candidatus Tokpelaia sp. JSC085]